MIIYGTTLEAFKQRTYVSGWKAALDGAPWPTIALETGAARMHLYPSVEQLRKLANDLLQVAGEVEKAQMEAK